MRFRFHGKLSSVFGLSWKTGIYHDPKRHFWRSWKTERSLPWHKNGSKSFFFFFVCEEGGCFFGCFNEKMKWSVYNKIKNYDPRFDIFSSSNENSHQKQIENMIILAPNTNFSTIWKLFLVSCVCIITPDSCVTGHRHNLCKPNQEIHPHCCLFLSLDVSKSLDVLCVSFRRVKIDFI